MSEEQKTLCQELELTDTALGFLSLIVLSVLISFWATARQRDALCLTIQGETEQAACVGEVSCLRLAASALIVGSLGFFFMQALDTCRNADPEDPVARKSARLNVIASFLVLLAALVRLLQFNFARRARSDETQEQPPD